MARDGYCCAACGSKDSLTVDHIIPLRDGGKSRHDNLITLCRPCNMKKGVRTNDSLVLQAIALKRNVTVKSSQSNDDVTVMSEEKRSEVEVKRSEVNLKPRAQETPVDNLTTNQANNPTINTVIKNLTVQPERPKARTREEQMAFVAANKDKKP